ncbi:MAG TPA: phosphomannomutase/phosphoglucomutase [Thermodesulfobacteriota bacterium]|nr:phosphomannomutase/phosphoglucomutase [Thermodesulfobacteriota bacterium]
MNHRIFREYDIRGIVDEDLTDETVSLIGRSFATYVSGKGKKRVAVGRDGRLSSPRFRGPLVEAMVKGGLDVVDVGVCPTPVFYYSLYHLERDGGVMITGSHNPPDFNGFKICVGKDTLFGEEIQKLRAIIDSGKFSSGAGSLSSYDIIPPYLDYLRNNIRLERKMKVVVDSGNGTAGLVAPRILRDLGCEVVELYSEVDGSFPHHHPDPTIPENLKDLIDAVRKSGADAGIGYDGDADRIGAVDHEGNIIWGDQLMILFSRDILSRNRGATVISEVKSSQNLYDDIARNGGRGIMWRAGHSLLRNKMKEEKALLGGEMSGHIFFADRYFGYDDAIYASCRLLEILSRSGLRIPDMLSDIPKTYNTPEIRVDCPDDRKFELVERVKESFRKEYPIVDIDGVRILFPDGWGLVRASNTQPVMVLRFEARTPDRLGEIRSLVERRVSELSR